jgi:8-oxo-dGTP pyrophosphatase MutT (NUDIX family)
MAGGFRASSRNNAAPCVIKKKGILLFLHFWASSLPWCGAWYFSSRNLAMNRPLIGAGIRAAGGAQCDSIATLPQSPPKPSADSMDRDSQFSLADDFLIVTSYQIPNDSETTKGFSATWTMTPLPTATKDSISADTEAACMTHNVLLHPTEVIGDENNRRNTCTLRCRVTEPANASTYRFQIETAWDSPLESSAGIDPEHHEHSSGIFMLLSRLFLQWAVRKWIAAKTIDTETGLSSIQVEFIEPSRETASFDLNALLPQTDGKLSSTMVNLFLPLFPESVSEADVEKMEWIEMVDRDGSPLGLVPRPLVHQYNLLHRGIGIVVAANPDAVTTPISPSGIGPATLVYVHRRVPTKRIFPDLYDMFVGGISRPGELPRATAIREVAEELGLLRGQAAVSSTPWFTCLVCTSYNRCIVSTFVYSADPSHEVVAWQDDEVAWGSFVPYGIVEKAAALSIHRLMARQEWPGGPRTAPDYRSSHSDVIASSSSEWGSWETWDFVPDGLLVWDAWLEFMERQSVD